MCFKGRTLGTTVCYLLLLFVIPYSIPSHFCHVTFVLLQNSLCRCQSVSGSLELCVCKTRHCTHTHWCSEPGGNALVTIILLPAGYAFILTQHPYPASLSLYKCTCWKLIYSFLTLFSSLFSHSSSFMGHFIQSFPPISHAFFPLFMRYYYEVIFIIF